ncbi:peptidoglycan-binding protein [Rhizobium leguminosarum]|uniref:Peptidoglycan-binding protein n=2 Tax=Rhizobium leguminosarum TaxID=384 RepID=A0A4Q8XNW2_RHILE|nr:peptidoglycan-binding protein [Rhizobium leguminosarum]
MRSYIAVISAALVFSVATTSTARAGGRDVAIGVGIGVLLDRLMTQPTGPRHGGSPERPRPKRPDPERDAARAEERQRAQAEVAEMRDIQTRLNVLNFSAGTPDGKAGPQTRTAIRAFQQSLNMPETGELDDNQKNMLISTTSTAAAAPAPTGDLPAIGRSASMPSANTPATGFQNNLPAPATPLTISNPSDGNANASLTGASATLPGSLPLSGLVSGSGTAEPPAVSILGVQPLISGDDALAKLQAASAAEDCDRQPAAIVCHIDTQAFSDEITVGVMRRENGGLVHTVLRSMTFNQPIDRPTLEGKLVESYPALMASQNHSVSSSAECGEIADQFRADDFSLLKNWIASGDGANAQVQAMAQKCDYHYELSIPEGDKISRISVTLFSGKPIMSAVPGGQAAGGAAAAQPSALPEIRF